MLAPIQERCRAARMWWDGTPGPLPSGASMMAEGAPCCAGRCCAALASTIGNLLGLGFAGCSCGSSAQALRGGAGTGGFFAGAASDPGGFFAGAASDRGGFLGGAASDSGLPRGGAGSLIAAGGAGCFGGGGCGGAVRVGGGPGCGCGFGGPNAHCDPPTQPGTPACQLRQRSGGGF